VGLSRRKAGFFWDFFLGPVLSIPLLAIIWLLRERHVRLLLLQCGLSFAGLFIVVWFLPHYAAPMMATLVLLILVGLRRLHTWRFLNQPVGAGIVRLIVLFNLLIPAVYFITVHYSLLSGFWAFAPGDSPAKGILLLVVLVLAIWLVRMQSVRATELQVLELPLLIFAMLQVCIAQRNFHPTHFLYDSGYSEFTRSAVVRRLDALPGQHLVLVRYTRDPNFGQEYVYNRADIDGAKIVWAREIPGVDTAPLLNYFRNREVWLFEPDRDNERVIPYSRDSNVP
jgi:hypothetical protein